ncbi:MAG: TIGR03618 family F420-dependent PPOX class oxidoreductase [Chloroflexi bacterium]|nr:TIGR03618 family F420-dependent PPOX class oxidoreductase [Chloroflexota bacterium]
MYLKRREGRTIEWLLGKGKRYTGAARMSVSEALDFVRTHHMAVLSTFRKDGNAQMSIVTAGALDGHIAFTTRGEAAKLANLRRNPRCSLLCASRDWRTYIVVESMAEVRDLSKDNPDRLRLLLRDVYHACADKEHPNWSEYDEAMREQRRAVIMMNPSRVYGTA